MTWRGLLYFLHNAAKVKVDSVVLCNYHFSLRFFLPIILPFYLFLQCVYLLSMPHARTLACHTAKHVIRQEGQQGRGTLHTSRPYVGDSETDVDD